MTDAIDVVWQSKRLRQPSAAINVQENGHHNTGIMVHLEVWDKRGAGRPGMAILRHMESRTVPGLSLPKRYLL